jgi:hypothetical protein
MSSHSWYNFLNQEASFSGLMGFLGHFFRLVRKNLLILLLCLLIGGLVGGAVSLLKPIKFKAEIVFAAEEEGSNAFEGLMAQFGLDVGAAKTGGVFVGEALIKVFQTRQMLERTLLKKAFLNGDSIILAQFLLPTTKFGKKSIFKDVKFNDDRSKHDRLTDSAVFLLQHHVRTKLLSVNKPDKRQAIMNLSVTHNDPAFAKAMSETLLKQVSDYYTEIVTKKSRHNLSILKAESDSIKQVVNYNLSSNAVESDLNVNPLKQSLRVDQNRKMIDLQVSVALYGEIVKNLKLAEISLRKQTPLIQVIDSPVMPLEESGYELWEWMIIGMLMGTLFFGFFIYKKDSTAATLTAN